MDLVDLGLLDDEDLTVVLRKQFNVESNLNLKTTVTKTYMSRLSIDDEINLEKMQIYVNKFKVIIHTNPQFLNVLEAKVLCEAMN